ncbi:MAG: branched-chain amino acid transport system / permease component family protein [Marmoricola sp.]|jgi:ribose transport system permease protein|nr:branched-chain amino acid transport system / permease component family protein [Marmoricola sp.]
MSALRSVRTGARSLSYSFPIVAGVVVLCVASSIFSSGFLAPSSWAPTLSGAAPIILLSMAQAVAVIGGRAGVDLSVGPLAGLVNAIVVVELAGRGITDPFVVIPVCLAIGLASGALNGFLIAYLGVPAIVATLGTYLAYLGLTLEILPTSGGAVPMWLADLTGQVGPVPGMLVVILAVSLAWMLLISTAFRRNLYATGADERAAYTSGVDVPLTRFLAYCVAGAIASIGGLALTGLLQSGDPGVSSVFTLQSIAAVALGGVLLSGGRGGLLGAACGGAALFLVQNLLSLAHVGLDGLQIAYGLILLLAITANSVAGWARRRRKAVAMVPTREEDALAPATA